MMQWKCHMLESMYHFPKCKSTLFSQINKFLDICAGKCSDLCWSFFFDFFESLVLAHTDM